MGLFNELTLLNLAYWQSHDFVKFIQKHNLLMIDARDTIFTIVRNVLQGSK